jgi:hypothetical protein
VAHHVILPAKYRACPCLAHGSPAPTGPIRSPRWSPPPGAAEMCWRSRRHRAATQTKMLAAQRAHSEEKKPCTIPPPPPPGRIHLILFHGTQTKPLLLNPRARIAPSETARASIEQAPAKLTTVLLPRCCCDERKRSVDMVPRWVKFVFVHIYSV